MREKVSFEGPTARATTLLPRVGRPLKNGAAFWRGAINLSYATIEGTVDLSGAELHGALRLDYADVKQNINLEPKIFGEGALTKTLEPCRIKGVKQFSIEASALQVGGALRASAVQCEGGICLNYARITQGLTGMASKIRRI